MSHTVYCPFCGSDKTHVDTKQSRYKEGGYYRTSFRINTVTATVRCSKCFSRGPTVSGKVLDYGSFSAADLNVVLTTKDELKRLAIEAWNKRSSDTNTVCGAWNACWESMKKEKSLNAE